MNRKKINKLMSILITSVLFSINALESVHAIEDVTNSYKKLGEKQARNFIAQRVIQKIKNKLIAVGFSALAGYISSTLMSALQNILDPGTALAKLLDKKDGFGQNGYIEV
ncbi:MAG: hypothetical protein LBR30_01680 [Clostridioides sp.]|jgi:hypothetical protein|nr:hypothetical protein [Clostridioides sp.]